MNRPLRVLIGADTYPPDINGAARFTARLAAGLARRGHEVHVVAPSDTGAASSPVQGDGVPAVHRLRSYRVPGQDRRNGLLYRPGDVAGLAAALTALLRDPAARARMGAAGREAAAAHDLDATLDEFEDVYADVRRGAARFRACHPVGSVR